MQKVLQLEISELSICTVELFISSIPSASLPKLLNIIVLLITELDPEKRATAAPY